MRMLSDGELETMQNLFCVEKEIVLFELRKMIEKTHLIEKLLQEVVHGENAGENAGDSYRPCPETIYPPKKRMKL